jgi:hypothetical protein
VDRPYFNVFTDFPKYPDNPLPRSCLFVVVENAHAGRSPQGCDLFDSNLEYLDALFRTPIRAERSRLSNEISHSGFSPSTIRKFDFQIVMSVRITFRRLSL